MPAFPGSEYAMMPALAAFAAVFALLASEAPAASASEARGPVLRFRGKDCVTVSWAPATDGSAVLGLHPVSGEGGTEMSFAGRTPGGAAEFELKGLGAGEEFFYSLSCGGRRQGPFRFRMPSESEFTAVAAGRTSGPWNRLVGVCAAMLNRGPSMALFPSALEDNCRAEAAEQEDFLAAAGQLLASVPSLMPRIGGCAADSPMAALFGVRDGGGVEVVCAAGVVFALIKPGWPSADTKRIVDFLAVELGREAEFRIALIPRPLVHSGIRGCDRDARREILPVLLKGGVDLVLSVGESSYERTRPVGIEAAAAAVHIAIGGGARVEKISPLPWTACCSDDCHFLLMRKSARSLEISAIDLEGIILDRFELFAGWNRGLKQGGAFLLRDPRISEGERLAMKTLSRALEDLGSALASDKMQGLKDLAAKLRDSAASACSAQAFSDLKDLTGSIARDSAALTAADLSSVESRITAGFRLDSMRETCKRCHGLFR